MFLGEMHDKKVMRKNKKTFFNYRTVFPVQKVSFLAAKIPMGEKKFFVLLRKENKSARTEEKESYN